MPRVLLTMKAGPFKSLFSRERRGRFKSQMPLMTGCRMPDSSSLNQIIFFFIATYFNMLTFSANELSLSRFALQHSLRPDFRKLLDSRPFQVNYSEHQGALQLSLNRTRVVSKVWSQISSPKQGRPNQGALRFNVDFGLNNQARHKSHQMQEVLMAVFLTSKAFDLGSLNILSRKFVWHLKVDSVVVHDDGNCFDALILANYLALKDFRKPFVQIVKEEVNIRNDRPAQPLSITQILLPFSFGLVGDEGGICLDASSKEEQVLTSQVHVVVNNYKQIVMIQKRGGSKIQLQVMNMIIKNALAGSPALLKRVRDSFRNS